MGQVGVAGNLDFTRIRSFDPKNKNANAIPTLKPIPSFNKSDPSFFFFETETEFHSIMKREYNKEIKENTRAGKLNTYSRI